MSIGVQPTPDHQALAAAVEARMAADSRIVNARAALLRLAGIGALFALIGLGIALALFGYSFIKDERSSADKIADSLVRALERTTLKTAGEVRVSEDSRVKLDAQALSLDPNATVRIDQPLKLDPAATVRLASDSARPSPEQLAGRQPAPTTPTAPTAVTNYTVFKNVKFAQGEVVTGWKFETSEQTAPSGQYCYYAQRSGEGEARAQVNVDIAINGVMVPNLRPRNFDAAAAAASCIWFDGRATRAS